MLLKLTSDEDAFGNCSLDGGRPSKVFFPVSCRCPTVRSQTAVTLDRMTWEHTQRHTHTLTGRARERERGHKIPCYCPSRLSKFNWPTCQKRKRKYTGLWTSPSAEDVFKPGCQFCFISPLCSSAERCFTQGSEVFERLPANRLSSLRC